MSELDDAIAAAYASEGKQEDVNKVYLTFFLANLVMPVQKLEEGEQVPGGEEFAPLFAKIDENYFLLVFDSVDRLVAWAGDQIDKIGYVEMTGRDVINGINDDVYLCLNLGTDFYKEFSPDEIKRLKMVGAKIDQLKGDK